MRVLSHVPNGTPMNHDLHQLANAVRHAHHIGRPICLPPMTMRDLGILLRLLDDLSPAIAHTSQRIH